MTSWTRRSFMIAGGVGLAACTSETLGTEENSRRNAIDAAVAKAQSELYNIPGAEQLNQTAQGVLIIPNISQVGFFASGAYGEGALLIGLGVAAAVAYCNATSSARLEIGRAHV